MTAFTIQNRVSNPSVSSTDTFTGDGSTTAFTLSGTPSSAHIMQVKKNGVLLEPIDDFTVSSTTLTLATALHQMIKLLQRLRTQLTLLKILPMRVVQHQHLM